VPTPPLGAVFVAAPVSFHADLGDPIRLPLLNACEPSACDQKRVQVADVVTLPLGQFLVGPSLRFAHQLAGLVLRLDVDYVNPRTGISAPATITANFAHNPSDTHRITG
jgi:hypothetical protein